MSSISVEELVYILNKYPKDYEVVMELRHLYDIKAEDGRKGWWAYINGIGKDDDREVIRLMN